LGPEVPGQFQGYTVRKSVTQKKATLPQGGPNLNPQTRPKNACNACWHKLGKPYTHKHCKKYLNNPQLSTYKLQLDLKIQNL
jgi:hypothetical protein